MESNGRSSSQLSRVSSSSSSTSQPYELIPKEQPFQKPQPDLPSPKTSFPFRKVQPGFESALSQHQSRHSSQNSRQYGVPESRQLIEAIGELQSSRDLRQSKGKGQNNIVSMQSYLTKIRELEAKLEEVEKARQSEKLDFQMEKKANEIYTDSFTKIRQLVLDQHYELEGEGIEELVQKISEILQEKREGDIKPSDQVSDDTRWTQLLEEKELKIRDLRDELLKSSQNNINAIFNTEITEVHCLHLQIKKMNAQITTLKDNLLKATLQQNKSKIVNVYHKGTSSSDEEDSKKYSKSKRRRRNSSSSSSRLEKSAILKNTEAKMGELLEGYKGLKEEYRRLEETLKGISGNQAQSKQLFQTLKVDISQSLHQQIEEVKMTIQRPSSSHQQKQIAKDLESKLNHLINTLNAPEKVNQERSLADESVSQSKSVEFQRKNFEMESRYTKLQKYVSELESQRETLKKQLKKIKQEEVRPVCLESRSSPRKYQLEELLACRSDIQQQEIAEQTSVEHPPNLIGSNINKVHSSQSYHQSNKHTDSQPLLRKIQFYRETLREKQLRITELQNTIFDHLHSKTAAEQPLTRDQLKQKYEHYILNLKLLLQEAKKENEMLRQQLIKVSEMSLSRANDVDHKSITLSDRTTKLPLAQTRLIKRPPNNYQHIQLKLQIEQELEKIFLTLLELYQKTTSLKEQDRKVLGNTLSGCIRWLANDARVSRSRLHEDTLQREDVQKVLNQTITSSQL